MRDHIETPELAGLVVKFAGQYGAFDDWVGLMSTDSLLYKDDGSGSSDPSRPDGASGKDPTAYKGGTGKAMAAMAMNALAQYDDGWGNLLAFLDTWDGAGLIVDGIFTTDDKLRTVFNNDPAAYVNAFDAEFGDDAIDSAVAALPRLSYLTHLSTAAVDLGIGLSSTLQLVTVVKDKQFDLATHDMYGSSRLGVKSYSPRQVGLGYTQAGGFTDTARLWTRRPWYSLQYQEIINQDSLNLYGNIHKDMYYTQHHTRGLKQYELTDHLGDVLATLSDKRATNDYASVSAGIDTITNYKPVVASAYDYYPFGQYMPGRYTEDTSSYCYTTTLTEMVTVVTQVPLVFSAGLRTVNNSTTGAGPDVRPTDDGGILIGIDGGDAGTGTGVSWPIGTLGGGGTTEPGDPIGGSGGGSGGGVGGGTTPIEGDVLVTATVSTGVFNVSVTDDNTGIDIGNVLVSSSDGTIIIKTHYTGVDGHGTSVHITLDHSAVDTNIIRVVTITVPHYTTVPVSVVSRVCSEESYRYGFNGQMKVNEWAGKGNHNTALYWEYDTRTGRRGNLDPIFKTWRSAYDVFDNNPISKVDPNGDDDYFNKEGKYIGSDGVGSAIRLMDNYNIQDKKTFNSTLAIARTLKIDIVKARNQISREIKFNPSIGVLKKLYSDAVNAGGSERGASVVLDHIKAEVDIRPTGGKHSKYETSKDNVGYEYHGEVGTVVMGNVHTHQEDGKFLGKQTDGTFVTDESSFNDQYRTVKSDGNTAVSDNCPTYTLGMANVDYFSPMGRSASQNNVVTRKFLEKGGFNIPLHLFKHLHK